MISYEEARRVIREMAHGRRMSTEPLPLEECTGRIVATGVLGSEFIPPFDNTAMDGFAVNAARTGAASPNTPIRFRVAGCIAAGDGEFAQALDAEAAVEIMTGAPMPGGPLDAVVKVEDVEVLRDREGTRIAAIVVRKQLKAGENVRRRGEDFSPGQQALAAGTHIMPEHVMALASLGVPTLSVRRHPCVAVISTGRELVHHSERNLAPGMIRSSTAPYLMTALPRYGASARYHGVIPDEPSHFIDVMSGILRDPPDLILTTGAVSMGKHDFIGAALEKLGATIRFHKTAIRPGKPLLVADWADRQDRAFEGRPSPVLFGLPGNPVSTAVGLRFFVEPYLRAVSGCPDERPIRAKLARDTSKPKGLRCFYKAGLEVSPDGARVTVLTGQPSFMVSPMLAANCWAVLDEDGMSVAADTEVDVYPLHPGPYGYSGASWQESNEKGKGCCS